MKKNLIYTALLCFAFFQANAQVVNIPDANFKASLLRQGVDVNGNGEIEISEAEATEMIEFFYDVENYGDTVSIVGIEKFINLKRFTTGGFLSGFDLSHNKELEELNMVGTSTITHLDLSNNTKLLTLNCSSSENLESIDLSKNVELTYLDCSWLGTKFKQIDLSQNKKLIYFAALNTAIQNLDLSQNIALEMVDIEGSSEIGGAMDLTKMNSLFAFIANGTSIVQICINNIQFENYQNQNLFIGVDSEQYISASCYLLASNIIPDTRFRNELIRLGYDTNNDENIQKEEVDSIATLNVSVLNIFSLEGIQYFKELTNLDCSYNLLNSLDLFENTKLEVLSCGNNLLTHLDLSNNIKLETLNFSYNYQLQSINISKNVELNYLDCSSNGPQFNQIDLSQNKKLKTFIAYNSDIENLDLSQNIALENIDINTSSKIGKEIDLTKMSNLQFILTSKTSLVKICVTDAQFESYQNYSIFIGVDSEEYISTSCHLLASNIIPDARFRNELIQLGYDTNNDENIQKEEVSSITKLEVQGKGILSFEGIQYFTELTYLNCSLNNLESLDLFGNTKLVKVYCHSNKLTQFKISKLKNRTLRTLVITNNNLSYLNLRTSTFLDKLWCYNNPLLTTICVASVAKATTSPEYRKSINANWTNSCGYVAREGEIEEEVELSESLTEMSIFPNPAKNFLQVNSIEQIEKINIKNLQGESLLFSEDPDKIDLVTLSAGIYLVEITTISGTEKRKLVKE